MLIKLKTLDGGSVFIRPDRVEFVSDGEQGTSVMLASGDEFDVEGSAAEVAQTIMMQAF